MPNGDLIPLQTDIKVENEVGQNNEATVTIQCIGDISELTEADRYYRDLKKEINDLRSDYDKVKEESYIANKNSNFWERQYEIEKNETSSYKLMFYTFLVLFLFVSIVLYFKL